MDKTIDWFHERIEYFVGICFENDSVEQSLYLIIY